MHPSATSLFAEAWKTESHTCTNLGGRRRSMRISVPVVDICWFARLTSVKTLSPLTVAVHATQSNPLLHALQHSTSWSMAPGSSTPGCSCFSISVRSPDWQETLARSAKSHLTDRNWTQITKSHFKLQYLSTSFHSQVVRPKNLLPSTLPPNLILNTPQEPWLSTGSILGGHVGGINHSEDGMLVTPTTSCAFCQDIIHIRLGQDLQSRLPSLWINVAESLRSGPFMAIWIWKISELFKSYSKRRAGPYLILHSMTSFDHRPRCPTQHLTWVIVPILQLSAPNPKTTVHLHKQKPCPIQNESTGWWSSNLYDLIETNEVTLWYFNIAMENGH